jgi:hypothetical protein
MRELAAARLGTVTDVRAPVAAALQSGIDELRDAAVPLLRQVAVHDRPEALRWWCEGPLDARVLVGALLRAVDRTLPPMPPWLSARATSGDPELRHQLAETQADAGDPGPAAALLASLPIDDGAAVQLLLTLGRCRGDVSAHVDVVLRFARSGRGDVRSAAIDVLARTRDGHAQAASFAVAENRQLWLRPGWEWTPALATAALAAWTELSPQQRESALPRITRTRPLPGDDAFAQALATAWGAASSWRERAALVPLALAAGIAPKFARGDVARMLDDARDDVHTAGLAIQLALGDRWLANAARIPTRSAEVRRALLHMFFVATRPDLRVDAAAWNDLPPDARLALAEWVVGQLHDVEAAASLVLELETDLAELLASHDSRIDQRLLHALARRAPMQVFAAWTALTARAQAAERPPERDVAQWWRCDLLRALGDSQAPQLLEPLRALLATDDAPLRRAVICALRCAGNDGGRAVLTLADEDLIEFIGELGSWRRAGSVFAPRLSQLVRSHRQPIAARPLLVTLVRIGTAGVTALEELQRDGVPVEQAIAWALQSDDEDTVIAAIRTIASLRTPMLVEALARGTPQVNSDRVERWLVVVCPQLDIRVPERRPQNVPAPKPPPLTAILFAADPELRREAIRCLECAKPAPDWRLPVLVEALADPVATVRVAAAEALRRRDAADRARVAVAVREQIAIETDGAVRALLQDW